MSEWLSIFSREIIKYDTFGYTTEKTHLKAANHEPSLSKLKDLSLRSVYSYLMDIYGFSRVSSLQKLCMGPIPKQNVELMLRN